MPSAAEIVRELHAAGPLVSAGVFAGDLADIGGAVSALERGGARAVHLDVGDGRYSPLMIGGPGEVEAVRTTAFKDVHLMIEEPLAHVERFAAAGADAITIQLDGGRHPLQALRAIGAAANASDASKPVLRGVCLGLDHPVAALEPLLDEVDLVLLLTVVPGFRAPLAASSPGRVAAVRALVDERGADVLVSVDGGITAATAPELAAAGADLLVAGTTLFAAPDPAIALHELASTIAGARARA
jgi:ribulose-phosphate 3-epimerase